MWKQGSRARAAWQQIQGEGKAVLRQDEIERVAEKLADYIFAASDPNNGPFGIEPTNCTAAPFIAEIIPAHADMPAIYETSPDHPGISGDPRSRAYQCCIFGRSPSALSSLVRSAHCVSLRAERRLLMKSYPPRHFARRMNRGFRTFLQWTFRALVRPE